MLQGTEVKSLREGRASLVDGYAFIDGGEIWLDAVHIPEYTEGTWNNHAPRRKRKLLMHKAQIIKISHKTKEGGYTLVPLSIYFNDGRAKVELAVAKGKREYDKRQALRERQDTREAAARDVVARGTWASSRGCATAGSADTGRRVRSSDAPPLSGRSGWSKIAQSVSVSPASYCSRVGGATGIAS